MLPAVGMLATHLHEMLFADAQEAQAKVEKPEPLPEVFPKMWTPDAELPDKEPLSDVTRCDQPTMGGQRLGCIDPCLGTPFVDDGDTLEGDNQ